MATITVEMTADEVKQAVREWAERHHGMKVKTVNYGAEFVYSSYGPNETEAPKPYVKFSAE